MRPVYRGVVVSVVVAGLALATPWTLRAQTGSPGTWTTLAPMPTARWGLAAATGSNGLIYAFGGSGAGGTALSIVEAYNASTNTWTCSVGDTSPGCTSATLAPMPTARDFFAAVAGRDGRVYLIGGLDAAGRPVTTVDVYDPASNRWGTIAPIPVSGSFSAATSGPDGRIYVVIGGGDGVATAVEVYDPLTGMWSAGAPLPDGRSGLAAATGFDGRIYAVGGWYFPPRGVAISLVEAYDPSVNSWTMLAPLPTARYGLAAVTGPDGRIFALGGCCFPAAEPSNLNEAYNPLTNTWTEQDPMPVAQESPGAALGPDGRIYSFGGVGTAPGAALLTTAQAFTPSLPPLPTLTPRPTVTPTPRAVATPNSTPVPGPPGATTASFTVTFTSTQPGQGEVYFGSGPGCLGLVEVATHDLHPGTTQHTVVVAGNDLPGTIGNNGIQPGATYWYETVTVTGSGAEIDNNGGQCYKATIPPL